MEHGRQYSKHSLVTPNRASHPGPGSERNPSEGRTDLSTRTAFQIMFLETFRAKKTKTKSKAPNKNPFMGWYFISWSHKDHYV